MHEKCKEYAKLIADGIEVYEIEAGNGKKLFEACKRNSTGSPGVGRGKTALEALGEYLVYHLGIAIYPNQKARECWALESASDMKFSKPPVRD